MKTIMLMSSLAVLLGLGTAGVGSTRSVMVKPFAVFVEPNSRYAFVRLPHGWKFVGELTEADMRTLPPQVLTSLTPRNHEWQGGE